MNNSDSIFGNKKYLEFPAFGWKSWDELDRMGKLSWLKENNPQLFYFKFKSQFGKAPNGITPDEELQKKFKELFDNREKNELSNMTWEEIDKKGLLQRLKELDPERYQYLYEERYNVASNL